MTEHPEKDSLLVEYDEDTRQMRLEWDDNDPKWSWLNSLSEEEALKRIRSQISNEERFIHADVSICNNGSQQQLNATVKREWDRMVERLGAQCSEQSNAKRAKRLAVVTAAMLRVPFDEVDRRRG